MPEHTRQEGGIRVPAAPFPFRLLLLCLPLFVPEAVAAQDEPAGSRPAWAITAGLGNVRGWLGINGEVFLGSGDWSLLAGLGYVPEDDINVESFVAFGAAARRYFGGGRHQGFGELSYSLVAVEQSGLFFGPEESDRLYGPGVGGGYRFTAGGGFHVELGLGVGVGTDGKVAPTGSLGIGFTGRR